MTRSYCQPKSRAASSSWLILMCLSMALGCSEPEGQTPVEKSSSTLTASATASTGSAVDAQAATGAPTTSSTMGGASEASSGMTGQSSTGSTLTAGDSVGSGGVGSGGVGTMTTSGTVTGTTSTSTATGVVSSGGASTSTVTAATGGGTGGVVDDGRGPHAPASGDIVVLYAGNGFDAWEPVDESKAEVDWNENAGAGYMEVAPTGANHIVTNGQHLHADVFLHLEFWTPNEPADQTGQNRGNSGVYLQSRYEQQVLDSYGRPPELDGCGAIYQVSAPLVNACRPAEEWNVYEIDFTAPRFENGVKTASARITTWLNGELVQDDVEVPGPTQAGVAGEVEGPQPLYLQDHNDTVRYRNIWWIHK